MLGSPIQFTNEQFALHERMCTILSQHFGNWIIDPNATKVSKIPGPGHSIKTVLKEVNTNLRPLLTLSAEQNEKASEYSLLADQLKQMSLDTKPPSSPKTLPETKREFYIDLHSKLFYCNTLYNYIFKELHRNAEQAKATHKDDFHQVSGYLLLLSCILGFNMLVYQTHPIYQAANTTSLQLLDNQKNFRLLFEKSYKLSQHLHCERIISLQSAISNWVTLLESFHLMDKRNTEFEKLRQLFIKRYNDFQKQLIAHPAFVDALPVAMRSKFSLKEMTYHLKQRQESASEKGFTFNPHVVYKEPQNLYLASPEAIQALNIKILEVCENKKVLGARGQILFYYNDPLGNVDVFDAHYNFQRNRLEIINIHVGNNPAQHDLLKKLTNFLQKSKLDFSLYACQANFGELQHPPALYALRLSLLLAKIDLSNIFANETDMPTFQDSTVEHTLTLEPLYGVQWFDIRALGPKAILLNSSVGKIRNLLANNFAKYKEQYRLSEATADDPDMLYTYADHYRKRLAYDFILQNFQGLSLDAIKKKLNVKSDDQAMRRAAAGYTTMREFSFLVDYFKKQNLPIEKDPLHLHSETAYTPLHWALKNQKASRAALLLKATAFTTEELAAKHNDSKEGKGKSAYDYFASAPTNSSIKQNTVLARFLKR